MLGGDPSEFSNLVYDWGSLEGWEQVPKHFGARAFLVGIQSIGVRSE